MQRALLFLRGNSAASPKMYLLHKRHGRNIMPPIASQFFPEFGNNPFEFA